MSEICVIFKQQVILSWLYHTQADTDRRDVWWFCQKIRRNDELDPNLNHDLILETVHLNSQLILVGK